jgi:FlgD Ig-like domain
VLVGDPEEVRKKLDDVVPRAFALGDNFPNPFNPSTTISVAVPLTAEVTLKIYNLLGEEIKTLQAGPLEAGRYWFTWDGRNNSGAQVASGIYLSRLTSSSGVSFTKKMVLMK